MIQDIFPEKLNNAFSVDYRPEKDDTVMHFKGGKVLACDDLSMPFPKFGQVTGIQKIVYMFAIGETRYFLALDDELIPSGGYIYKDIKKMRHESGALKPNILALFTAFHLWSWYTNNRICGYCGSPTVPDFNERALLCKNCCRVIYPRINPAVIVGVTNGDKMLITHYAKNRGVAYDALVAGFTEIGETFEETVAREVKEEVGLNVKNIRYYKSQPWGYSGSILAGFYCDVDGTTELNIDESELSNASWLSRDEIKGQPDDYSLTNEMMMNFIC